MEARSDQKASRRGGRLRRAAAAGIFLLIVAAGAFWTGWPQHLAMEQAAERVLGVDAEVEDVSLLGRVRMGTLRIYDGPDERARGAYTVDLRGLDLDYSVLAAGSRPFPEASIEALTIRLDGTDPGNTNYDFVTRLLNEPPAPGTDEPGHPAGPRLVPDSLALGTVALSVEQPGFSLGIRGLGLSLATADDALDLRVTGDEVAGWFGYGENPRLVSVERGAVDVQLRHAPRKTHAPRLRMSLPGLLELDASGTWEAGDGASALSAEVDTLCVEGTGVGELLAAISPLPVRFETLDLSGTRVLANLAGAETTFGSSEVRADVRNLAVGAPGHELFEGNVAVIGTLTDAAGHAEIVLGRGQQVAAHWAGGAGSTKLSLALDGWTVEELRDALPKDFRPALDGVTGLAGVKGSCTLAWEPPRYAINAEIAPNFAGQESFELALEAEGRTVAEGDDEPLVDGTCILGLGPGQVRVAGMYRSPESYRGTADLTAVDPWLFLGSALGMDPLLNLPDVQVSGAVSLRSAEGLVGDVELRFDGLGADATGVADVTATYAAGLSGGEPVSLDGRLIFPGTHGKGAAAFAFDGSVSTGGAGTLTFSDLDPFGVAGLLNLMAVVEGRRASVNGPVTVESDGELLSFAPNLTLASLAIGGWAVQDDTVLSAAGMIEWNASSGQVALPDMAVRLGEDGEIQVSDGKWNATADEAEGQVTCRIDLDYAGPAIGLSEVYGAWTVDAPVRYGAGVVTGTVAVTGDGAGFGAFSAPYGTLVSAMGNVTYDLTTGQGKVDGFEATWPSATRLTSHGLSFALDGPAMDGPFALVSDLAPLVDMALLESVEGRGEAKGAIVWADGAWAMDCDLEAEAESLVAAGAVAALEGLRARCSGHLNADGLNAEGSMHAVETAVAGVVLRGLTSPVHISEWVLSADGFEAELFDGSVKGIATLDLAKDGYPGRLSADLEALDLAVFCREFEPPGTQLTGRAGGRLVVEWSAGEMTALEVELACEEGFTMNRELIEQLLLKQVLGDAAGTKRLGKIREKVIGKAPQRPFDRAELTLRQDGDMLRGEVKLPSKQLNLTMDLNIDPRNILKALELRQESQLDRIDGITTGSSDS